MSNFSRMYDSNGNITNNQNHRGTAILNMLDCAIKHHPSIGHSWTEEYNHDKTVTSILARGFKGECMKLNANYGHYTGLKLSYARDYYGKSSHSEYLELYKDGIQLVRFIQLTSQFSVVFVMLNARSYVNQIITIDSKISEILDLFKDRTNEIINRLNTDCYFSYMDAFKEVSMLYKEFLIFASKILTLATIEARENSTKKNLAEFVNSIDSRMKQYGDSIRELTEQKLNTLKSLYN